MTRKIQSWWSRLPTGGKLIGKAGQPPDVKIGSLGLVVSLIMPDLKCTLISPLAKASENGPTFPPKPRRRQTFSANSEFIEGSREKVPLYPLHQGERARPAGSDRRESNPVREGGITT